MEVPLEPWHRVWIRTLLDVEERHLPLRSSLPGFWFTRWTARRACLLLLRPRKVQPRAGVLPVADLGAVRGLERVVLLHLRRRLPSR